MSQHLLEFPQKSEPMDANTDRENLRRLRDECLRSLVELASDRQKAESLMSTFCSLEWAIQTIEPPMYKYGRHKGAKQAIQQYLSEDGRAADPDELVEAVTAGGFRHGASNVKGVLRKALSYYLDHPQGSKLRFIRRRNGLVGLYEWPDSKFE